LIGVKKGLATQTL